MTKKRKVEVFTAGCPACKEAIRLVESIACPSCEVLVRDMNDADVAERARNLGINRVPTVVIDGKLAECCAREGLSETSLRGAGLGVALV